jgi:hypothetical protein
MAFFAAPFLFHMPRFRKVLADHPDVYGSIGITPSTDPINVLYIIDRFDKLGFGRDTSADPADTSQSVKDIANVQRAQRAKGLLYGYPLYAVKASDELMYEIWVNRNALASAKDSGKTVIIPHHSGTGFRYHSSLSSTKLTALEAARNDAEDRLIQESAAKILSQYEERRAKYIGPSKPGVVAMLRDWLCRNDKDCGPNNISIGGPEPTPAR